MGWCRESRSICPAGAHSPIDVLALDPSSCAETVPKPVLLGPSSYPKGRTVVVVLTMVLFRHGEDRGGDGRYVSSPSSGGGDGSARVGHDAYGRGVGGARDRVAQAVGSGWAQEHRVQEVPIGLTFVKATAAVEAGVVPRSDAAGRARRQFDGWRGSCDAQPRPRESGAAARRYAASGSRQVACPHRGGARRAGAVRPHDL